jgi:hypothetical protein
MSEEQSQQKSKELRPTAKGNIFLEIGIVLMVGILIWSIVVPMQERETERLLTKLSRAKMRTLFQLQYLYLYEDTTYTTDLQKLVAFAKRADTTIVPDSLFRPMYQAYLRFDEHRDALENMSLHDFRMKYLDSAMINPLSGEKFIVETMVKTGRKTFSIKPTNDEKELKRVGGVIEGEISWDDRADMIL